MFLGVSFFDIKIIVDLISDSLKKKEEQKKSKVMTVEPIENLKI